MKPSSKTLKLDKVEELRAKVPAPLFALKVYVLLEDPQSRGIAEWGPNGTSFVIKNRDALEATTLPKYFGHGTLKSFVRQLNAHGFSKSKRRVCSCNSEPIEYSHPDFVEGDPDRLCFIRRQLNRRRPSNTSSCGSSPGISHVPLRRAGASPQTPVKELLNPGFDSLPPFRPRGSVSELLERNLQLNTPEIHEHGFAQTCAETGPPTYPSLASLQTPVIGAMSGKVQPETELPLSELDSAVGVSEALDPCTGASTADEMPFSLSLPTLYPPPPPPPDDTDDCSSTYYHEVEADCLLEGSHWEAMAEGLCAPSLPTQPPPQMPPSQILPPQMPTAELLPSQMLPPHLMSRDGSHQRPWCEDVPINGMLM